MTDNRTTELTASEKVKAMLKTREADYRVHHGITQGSMNYYDRYTVLIDGNPRASIDTGNGDEVVLKLRCTPEQAIAATLGNKSATHGTLIAEQVCETVLKHGNVMGPQFYGDWQAIADEFNAMFGERLESNNEDTDDALALLDEIREAGRISYDDYSQLFDAIAELGSGTCEQVLTGCDDGLMPPFTAHCSACGAEWGFTPKYCHNCGARVTGTRDERKAVER